MQLCWQGKGGGEVKMEDNTLCGYLDNDTKNNVETEIDLVLKVTLLQKSVPIQRWLSHTWIAGAVKGDNNSLLRDGAAAEQ